MFLPDVADFGPQKSAATGASTAATEDGELPLVMQQGEQVAPRTAVLYYGPTLSRKERQRQDESNEVLSCYFLKKFSTVGGHVRLAHGRMRIIDPGHGTN